MNQFVSLSLHRRAGIVLSVLLVLVTLGCAPAPAVLRSSAPLQLLVFYSPL